VRGHRLNTDQKILEVEHLFVTLDGKQILRDISFSLNKGDALAIVGPNGALAQRCPGRLEPWRGVGLVCWAVAEWLESRQGT